MNIDELRYFVEAAKEQNLSHAARVLGITQSTLSHAIRRLENELGRPLFRKEGRRVRLTIHGQRFAERAACLVEGIHNLKVEMRSEQAPLLGHFRIGSPHGGPTRLLAQAWNRLPTGRSATVEISGMRSSEVLRRTGERELDLGLCFDPQPYPEIGSSVIASSPSLVAVRSGHPLRRARGRTGPAELGRYPFASAKHLPGVVACSEHPIFRELGRPITPRFFFDNYDVAREILMTSDAWAILPAATIAESTGKLRPLCEDQREPLRLSLVWNQANAHPSLIRELEKELKQTARRLGWEVAEEEAGAPRDRGPA